LKCKTLLGGTRRVVLLLVFRLLVFSRRRSILYVSSIFMVDTVTLILLALTLFLFGVYFLSLLEVRRPYNVALVLSALGGRVCLCFIRNEVLSFFLFFELSLLPTAFLIFSFGLNPERLSAVSYFILYTSVGSFPLLLNIVSRTGMFSFRGSPYLNMEVRALRIRLVRLRLFFWGFAFLIKSPMYGVHLWLPKAHVEAPTVGRMILAAILLKLGIYGLIRFSVFFEASGFLWILLGWIRLSLVFRSIVRFRSIDLKIFIAYSSIAHMGIVLLGFWNFTSISFLGIILIRVGHGFRSRGLFSSVKFFYKGVGSRNLIFTLGALTLSPLFVSILFLLCCSKASVPPFLSLFGEIRIFSRLLTVFFPVALFVVCYVFLVGLYNVYLYLRLSHGLKRVRLRKNISMDLSLKLNLLPHIVVGLGIFTFCFI